MEYGATPGHFWQFLVCSFLALPRCTAIFSLEERVLVARKDFQGCETEVLATLSLHCNAWRGGVRALCDEDSVSFPIRYVSLRSKTLYLLPTIPDVDVKGN
jgi:hypothetical protein